MGKSKFAPRGIRNRNPLNIRRSKTPWLGEVDHIDVADTKGESGAARFCDRSFCQFSDVKYGYRAAFKLIKKYIEVYECDTIRKIINRWAPPTENNTNNYVEHVCAWQCLDEDAKITTSNYNGLVRLVIGMTMVENGKDYDPNLHFGLFEGILEGFAMAFGVDFRPS